MAKNSKHKKLTPKQKRFCEEYVIDLNGTQAAVRTGYSEKTANRIASENLSKPDIQNYISELQKDIQERNKITVDECVTILSKIARHDIADFYEENGSLKSIHNIPKDSRLAISELSVFEEFEGKGKDRELIGFTKKIKTLDRKGVIVELMKHLGGYEKDNNQKKALIDLSQLTPETLMQIWNARSND
ncbi:terminase small subunit [Tenacibaculum maritimum]|uniref:terminase small subunit n=1 Tax=Tenacibaculum maritimum TaxID=107401 RepID=UPI0012E448EE|nr:terminase small subunit [Tenacibaculum maritimum]CAA0254351.1 conserved hypothetical protein [Tenacibaculum maritimum]